MKGTMTVPEALSFLQFAQENLKLLPSEEGLDLQFAIAISTLEHVDSDQVAEILHNIMATLTYLHGAAVTVQLDIRGSDQRNDEYRNAIKEDLDNAKETKKIS